MNFAEFKVAYMEELKLKNISRRIHPENDNLFILRYTDRCVFNKNWNEVNRVCRDLVVNEATDEIVARGFTKFFSQKQRKDFNTEYLNQEYPLNKVEVTEKLDGIQAVSYELNGQMRFASEGSFTSESSQCAQKIWNDKYSHVQDNVPEELTLVVELIHPDFKVVVPYGFEDLVLVGAVNRHTQHDFNYEELTELALTLGMKVPKKHDVTFEEAVEIAQKSDYDFEGFVLRYGNDERIKVKGNEYLRVFRYSHLLSHKQRMQLWVNNVIDVVISSLPKEIAVDYSILSGFYELEKEKILEEAQKNLNMAPKDTKKDLAIWIQKNSIPNQKVVFKLYDEKLTNDDLKMAVYHNTYVEGKGEKA